MERDLELAHSILEAIARTKSEEVMFASNTFEGVTSEQVSCHLRLLEDAGYVQITRPLTARLTWTGHDYLADVRSYG